jgi:sugar O-acyltransferase (sialic acid O-acetyltransferase NeuD family)
MTKILILGAGSTSQEIAEILIEQARQGAATQLLGFLDDDAHARGLPDLGVRVIGSTDQAYRFPDTHFVMGIAGYTNPKLRKQICERLGLAPDRYYTVVHPSAEVSPSASLGPGCVLMQKVIIGRGVRLNNNVLVTQGCFIGHDSAVDQFAVFAPNVTVCGLSRIGESVYFGAGSTSAPGVEIGSESLIGIGSVVLQSVQPGCTVFGNPARIIQSTANQRWNPRGRG